MKRVSRLNQAQRQAVNHAKGPLLVIAGAGTGKTFVIVQRIRRLLAEGVPAQQLLAVTFTEKAAAEMLDRVVETQQSYELTLPIMTFNAFGESLLREFSADIGLGRNFRVLGEQAQIVFLRQHLDELVLDYFSPVGQPDALLGDIAKLFSRLKQHLITPENYLQFSRSLRPGRDTAARFDKTKHAELAGAYARYIKLCRSANLIDYDDQIFLAVELLQRRPNVRALLQQRYHSVLVDEFQDTNPMQFKLIELIIGASQNLVVVGDDDQAIYGFRGATLANMQQFKQHYPAAKEVALRDNYRSTQAILDAAYRLIQANNPHRLEAQLGIDKRLRAQTQGKTPQLRHFEDLTAELDGLAQAVASDLKRGVPAGDVAVLCRRNATAQLVAEALAAHGVEHVLIGQSHNLYQETIVRSLVETLKSLIDPHDNVSFYHTLTGPLFGINNASLVHVAAAARREHDSLEAIIAASTSKQLESARKALVQLRGWRERVPLIPVGQLVYQIMDQSGYKARLYASARRNADVAAAVVRLSQYFSSLKEFESIAVQPTAVQYLSSLPALQAAGEGVEDDTLELSRSAVNVLTVHKAKGLEWRSVYIPDLTEGSFPLRAIAPGLQPPTELTAASSTPADSHLAEERRLLYVAMTRAKQKLVLSYADRHATPTYRKPSRFLQDIFGPLDTISKPHEPQRSSPIKPQRHESTRSTKNALPAALMQGTKLKLSVSQLLCYLRCPQEFHYLFVLGAPQPPDVRRDYGTLMHRVIERFNKGLIAGSVPSLESLVQELEVHWPKEGYASVVQRERARQHAYATITAFYRRHTGNGAAIPQAAELAFSVLLHPESVVLRGRFDSVYQHELGSEIRDYKTTARVETPEAAQRRARASEQLTLYALVWQQMHGQLPNRLSLEFIDTGQVGSVSRTQPSIERMRQKVATAVTSLRAGKFEPAATHAHCHHPM